MRRFFAKPVNALLVFLLILFTVLMPLQPLVSAQATEEACDEAKLRDLGVAIVGCSQTPSQCAVPTGAATTSGDVFIVGDSLSEGLRDAGKIQDKFKVKNINATVNGLHSRPLSGPSFTGGDGLSIIGSDPALKTASTVVVELGTNDPGNLAGHLPEAIDKIRSLNSQAKIYWVNLAPDSTYAAANQVIDQQATPKNYQVIKWSTVANGFLTPGDVHPSAAGYDALADLIVTGVTTAGTASAPSGGDCSCGGSNLSGSDNAEKSWNFLISKGMTPTQAAGAMGNMSHEGGFNPRQVEIAYSDPPHQSDTIPASVGPAGQPGYGIIQWTSPGRKQALQALADSSKRPVNDLALQLDFMWSELEGPYKTSTLDPLLKATDLAAAVHIWQDHYEVGANFEPRFTSAQDMLAQYGSGTTAAGSPSGCQVDASGCPSKPVAETETVMAGGVRVHPCISAEVERIITLANEQGIKLTGDGWVSAETQIAKRKNNKCPDIYESPASDCSPPTAKPGESRHERGTGIDFSCNGALVAKSDACFKFLEENTKLINLKSEAWHWSVDGS